MPAAPELQLKQLDKIVIILIERGYISGINTLRLWTNSPIPGSMPIQGRAKVKLWSNKKAGPETALP